MAASSRRGGSCARAVRSCCNQFIRLWLLVLNVIDGVAGVLLLAWGFVLHAKLMRAGDGSEGYVCWSALALGAALTLAAALSFVGAAVQCCRCGLCLSAWLSIPIAFFELGVAVYTLAEEAKFFRMLRDHKAQLPVRVELLEDWQKPITAALFALALAEAARAVLSTTLRRHINLNVAEYDALLREAEASDARSDLEARLLVKEKYDYMREKYRAKYARDEDDYDDRYQTATEMT